MPSERELKAHKEASNIEVELSDCVSSDHSNEDKLQTCRSLLKRLHNVFDGLQCEASNDKISNPLHWKITDVIVSITDDNGEAIEKVG